MPHSQFEWLARLKAVEREFVAVQQATARFRGEARTDPTILRSHIGPRDIEGAWARLEGTYVIRLFAEFETGLRLFWGTVKKSRPTVRHLIDSVGALRGIPTDVIGDVHLAREYRNTLVHERQDEADEVSIALARRGLCKYFSRLPASW